MNAETRPLPSIRPTCAITSARAFDNSSTLNSLIESDVGISPTIYEITISDQNGIVLLSSDSSLRDEKVAARPPDQLPGSRRIF